MKHLTHFHFLITLLIVLLVMLILPFPAQASSSAQAPGSPPVNLQTFLQWLIGGGGSILAVSWILERMPWFQRLAPETKDYTIFGLAAVVGCGALAVVLYVPPAFLEEIAPYFLIIASTFVTVFIAKAFHLADKVQDKSQSAVISGDKQ